MKLIEKIAPFFSGWNETLIWSCLQGCMGYCITDEPECPTAAQLVVADFCFFAGIPNNELVAQAAAPILVPQNKQWEEAIASVWGSQVEKNLRYAIKKEPDVFQIDLLTEYTHSLRDGYELHMIDEKIYDSVMKYDWSRDFCSQFLNYADYQKRGIGVVVTYQNLPVSGASSYTVYDGGIEIEIDTMPNHRKKGLATVCGAKLILECLSRGLYPSWDAFDLRSVSLAEKLGYHLDHPYTVFTKK